MTTEERTEGEDAATMRHGKGQDQDDLRPYAPKDITYIDEALLSQLHGAAQGSERLRMNLDLRTTPKDGSQRMLNALEPGTRVPIHRHPATTETVVCMEGCLDEVFYTEIPAAPGGDASTRLVEVARYRLCPREGKFGIQVPMGAWHTIEVYEPSVIIEAKDGPYSPGATQAPAV